MRGKRKVERNTSALALQLEAMQENLGVFRQRKIEERSSLLSFPASEAVSDYYHLAH